MVKAAVLVSGGGTNLAALLASQDSGVIRSAEIALVAADRPCQALARAEERGIRTVLLDRKSLRREAFEEGLVREIDAAGCTLIVLAGFLSILSAAFVKRYPDRIINVHPSLIPSFCGKGFYGLHVHEAALRRGVRITGATVHLVNEEPDGGRILKQKAVEVLHVLIKISGGRCKTWNLTSELSFLTLRLGSLFLVKSRIERTVLFRTSQEITHYVMKQQNIFLEVHHIHEQFPTVNLWES